MQKVLGDHLPELFAAAELLKMLSDESDHSLEHLGRHIDAAKAFGDGNDTHRQRLPGADRRRHPAGPARTAAAKIQPSQLRRAAADVEQDDAGGVRIDEPGADLASADYWVRHVREAVRFGSGVRALSEAGAETYVEVGPKATLLGLVGASAKGRAELVASLLW